MNLEKARKEIEYERVMLSLKEREFKILERLEEIERLKDENSKSQERLDELKEIINQFKE